MKNLMTVKLIGLTAVAAMSLVSFGCSNMVNGAKQDAAANTQKAAEAAKKVGNTVKDVPQDVNSAHAVTPEVKTSIIRDPVLNDPHNVVNVDSHDHVTHLTGHVQSDSMKQRATEDAQAVLNKRHPNYKVSNELTISGGTAQ